MRYPYVFFFHTFVIVKVLIISWFSKRKIIDNRILTVDQRCSNTSGLYLISYRMVKGEILFSYHGLVSVVSV